MQDINPRKKSVGRDRDKLKNLATKCRIPESYPWKILNCLIKDLGEYLDDDERKRISSIANMRSVDLYLKLSEDWGLQCIIPDESRSLENIRAKILLSSVLKKYQFNGDTLSRKLKALEAFKNAEEACEKVNCRHIEYSFDEEGHFLEQPLYFMREFVENVIGTDLPPTFDTLTHCSRHGPGVTLSTKANKTSAYHKFAELPYSVTPQARYYAQRLIQDDQRWFDSLLQNYCKRNNILCATSYYNGSITYAPLSSIDWKDFWDTTLEDVEGNRIAFVPKDAVKDRTIAIEPTMNLMLQLGVDGFIRNRLKRWGVDLDTQVKNQQLARRGSIDNSFVTIDLKSASDSISVSLVKGLLPRCWFSYLMAIRAPKGELKDPSSGLNILVDYQKISSMGNGYTFALESLIFTSMIYACFKWYNIPFDRQNFACFGDDLIVPTRFYPLLDSLLRYCGFTLNAEKSFIRSNFVRESCGTDWCNARNVRGVNLLERPKNVPDLYSDFNRLNRIYSVYFGRPVSAESELSLMFKGWIPRVLHLYGPVSDNDFDSYIHTDLPGRVSIPPTEHEPIKLLGFGDNEYYFPETKVVYSYVFKRLVRIRNEDKTSKEFLFRRLMARLGPSTSDNKWMKRKFHSIGGHFVVHSNSFRISVVSSIENYWRQEYISPDEISSEDMSFGT
jgi:hypothetical protein